MGVKKVELSDEEILFMFAKNNPLAWNALYESYSGLIYGLVSQQTKDQKLKDDIFENVFVELKNYLLTTHDLISLKILVCRFTTQFTKNYLRNRGIISPKTEIRKDSMVHAVLQSTITLPELAQHLEITETEVKKRIRLELTTLRSELSS